MKEKTEISTFNNNESEMVSKELDFLTNSSEILNALYDSKNGGKLIGIRAESLGPDVVLTGVEDVLHESGETIVIFKHYDSSGYILPSRKLKLSDIREAHPFSTPFINPFLNNLGRISTT